MAGKVKAMGMSLWHATAGTAWTPTLPGADPGSPWVEVTDLNDIDVKPFEIEEFDTSNLEDSDVEMDEEHKPGSVTVNKDKNNQSVALDAIQQNKTLKAWAVLYPDGTARYNANCRLLPESGGRGAKGDKKAFATESYRIRAVAGYFALQDAATPP